MDVKKIIRKFIEVNLIIFDDEAQFSDSDNIFELGFVNSLFAMKVLNYIENEFNITVSNEDIDIKNFSSVENIVGFINRKRKTSIVNE